MSEPAAKKQKTDPAYELIYWPGIPGRGEYIRLPLEATRTPYTDTAKDSSSPIDAVTSITDPTHTHPLPGQPPVFAVPALKIPGAGPKNTALLLHQTPTILRYLAPRIGLKPDSEADAAHVEQITDTVLDLSNEAHDMHHPIAVGEYYEEQKAEALRRSKDFRGARLPKFLGYFERCLKANEDEGKGRYLVGSRLSVADTTVWQVLSGLIFAVPKEMEARKGEFPVLLGRFFEGLREEEGLKGYLASERRAEFGNGLFRHYPELDRE